MTNAPTGPIDWSQVRASLPSTAHALLDELLAAWEEDAEQPTRAIEKRLRARLGALRGRFDALREAAAPGDEA